MTAFGESQPSLKKPWTTTSPDAQNRRLCGLNVVSTRPNRGFLFDIRGKREIVEDQVDIYLGTDNGGSLLPGFARASIFMLLSDNQTLRKYRTHSMSIVESPHLKALRDVSADVLVAALETPGVLGARLTGAGFGSCAVALVSTAQAETAAVRITAQYQQASGRTGTVYICAPSDGVSAEWIAEAQECNRS